MTTERKYTLKDFENMDLTALNYFAKTHADLDQNTKDLIQECIEKREIEREAKDEALIKRGRDLYAKEGRKLPEPAITLFPKTEKKVTSFLFYNKDAIELDDLKNNPKRPCSMTP